MPGWTRLRTERICGFCSATIPATTPVYELRLLSPDNPRYRCVDCAGKYFTTTPPSDLSPLQPLPEADAHDQAVPFHRFDRAQVAGDLRRHLLDARARQVGSE